MRNGSTSSQPVPICSTESSSSTLTSSTNRVDIGLRIALATGETLKLQLPEHFQAWKDREADPSFQARIRSLSFLRNGQTFTLAAPRAFRRVIYGMELSPGQGEKDAPASIRANYVADDITCVMTIYLGPQAVTRFDTHRSGKLRFRPPG